MTDDGGNGVVNPERQWDSDEEAKEIAEMQNYDHPSRNEPPEVEDEFDLFEDIYQDDTVVEEEEG